MHADVLRSQLLAQLSEDSPQDVHFVTNPEQSLPDVLPLDEDVPLSELHPIRIRQRSGSGAKILPRVRTFIDFSSRRFRRALPATPRPPCQLLGFAPHDAEGGHRRSIR
jgi:hypothetical protein